MEKTVVKRCGLHARSRTRSGRMIPKDVSRKVAPPIAIGRPFRQKRAPVSAALRIPATVRPGILVPPEGDGTFHPGSDRP